MAYVLKDEEKEQLQNNPPPLPGAGGEPVLNPQQTNNTGEPQQIVSGSGGPITAAGTSQQSASAAAPRKESSTGFIGINRYLEQNRPQTQKLAGRVGGVIEQEGAEVNQAIGESLQNISQQADEQTYALTDTFNTPETTRNAELVQQASTEDFSGFQDEGDADQFRALYTAGEYTGPSDISETEQYTDVLKERGDVQTIRESIQTDEGRKELLRRIQDTKRASQGVTTLDNALLGGNPEAQQSIQNTAEDVDASNQDRIDMANLFASQRGDQVTETNLATSGQLQEQFMGEEGIIPELAGDINTRQEEIDEVDRRAEITRIQNQQIESNNQQMRDQYDANLRQVQRVNGAIQQAAQEMRDNFGMLKTPSLLETAGMTWEEFKRDVANHPQVSQIASGEIGYHKEPVPPRYQSTTAVPTTNDTITPEEMGRLQALADLAGVEVQDLINQASA